MAKVDNNLVRVKFNDLSYNEGEARSKKIGTPTETGRTGQTTNVSTSENTGNLVNQMSGPRNTHYIGRTVEQQEVGGWDERRTEALKSYVRGTLEKNPAFRDDVTGEPLERAILSATEKICRDVRTRPDLTAQFSRKIDQLTAEKKEQ